MTLQEIINNNGKRKESFELMIQKLKTKNNPLIVETGCVRQLNDYGAGMSTVIFDKYIEENNGECYSIDNNPINIALAQSITKNINLICSDSVTYLFGMNNQLRKINKNIDLLYLDSFDLDISNPHPSSLHHILELICVWPSCGPNTIIAVDDNLEDGTGKGKYVKQFMKNIGLNPIFDGYQIIWEL